ncbi:hypothetical protein ACQKTA_04265 [Enterococcus sp. 22-H-5-01]|uniref:hypothetical protein n=1 Tax=Enterococcus sp. 22-H-5-01 TaxID=3418555 RepID=UPI003CFD0B01
MNEEEILKLLKLTIGGTTPHGSHGIDMDEIQPNIKLLGSVATELVCQLERIANAYEDRQENSIQACGKEARYWIDFIEKEVLGV